jgi:hypothetical protein
MMNMRVFQQIDFLDIRTPSRPYGNERGYRILGAIYDKFLSNFVFVLCTYSSLYTYRSTPPRSVCLIWFATYRFLQILHVDPADTVYILATCPSIVSQIQIQALDTTQTKNFQTRPIECFMPFFSVGWRSRVPGSLVCCISSCWESLISEASPRPIPDFTDPSLQPKLLVILKRTNSRPN